MKDLINILKSEEGFVPHAYEDHLGYLTIGYGQLIDKRKGGGISENIAEIMLKEKLTETIESVNKAFPWLKDHPQHVKDALYLMAYQIGVKALTGFSTTLKHIKAGNYQDASKSAMQSLWARQTPARAKRVCAMLSGKTS